MLRCPCGGDSGCADCGGTGNIEIRECPMKMITPDIWDFIGMAEFANEGEWPIAGGILDQCDSFVAAVRLFRKDEAVWKAKLGID